MQAPDPHTAAVTSRRETALTCGVPKKSLQSTAKAIRVGLALYLGVDLGYDHLFIRRIASKVLRIYDCKGSYL